MILEPCLYMSKQSTVGIYLIVFYVSNRINNQLQLIIIRQIKRLEIPPPDSSAFY